MITTHWPPPTLDELRRTIGGGCLAVTTLCLDGERVVKLTITNCTVEKWSWDGRFLGVVPDPETAFRTCLLHGIPSLKRGERGQIDEQALAAARAKFFPVNSGERSAS